MNVHSTHRFKFSLVSAGIFVCIFAVLGMIYLLSGRAATNLLGDINGDGSVGIFDLSLLLSSYGQTGSSCTTNTSYTCDLNSDGAVNIFDLSIVLSQYGQSVSAPVNTVPPVVSGTAVVGQVLTVSNGTWTGSPTSYAYQWQDCDASATNCSPIAGAPAATYTIVAGDVGSTIRAVVTASNAGGSASANSAPTGVVTSGGPAPLSIRVSGKSLVNGPGAVVQLTGVNVSAIGNCIPISQQPSGIIYAVDQSSAATVASEIAAWHANVVRIGMNEDCWLGINGVNPTYSGANYRNEVVSFVNALNQDGIYAIVDLHDNGPGTYAANSQQVMADADHATTYWQSVASTFKNNPAVLFEAYNGPHLTTSNTTDANAWDCWLNGCTSTETDQNQNQPTPGAPTWQVLGMQAIVNAIRTTGAANSILLGGLNWSQDLSSFLQYLPTDPQHQLVAAYHDYMGAGTANTLAYWDNTIAPIANQMPVVTSEMGEHDGGSSYNTSYLSWADSHGVSYIAWAWGPSTAYGNIALTTDWTSGQPSTYGETVFNNFKTVNP